MEGPIYRLENVVHDKQEAETDFVGPLDLILHLLSKNKLEIKDIPVAKILDQYMDWVARRQEMDLEVASEFIAMAAHLLYIKTRMLLSAQDEQALSEMEQLIASLEERQRHENYQRIKLSLDTMRSLYEVGSAYITRGAAPLAETGHPMEYSHGTAELLEAMERVAERNRRRQPPSPNEFHDIMAREPYPVERKSEELLTRLKKSGQTPLTQLWRESKSRSELVAVFVAVLELCRAGQLHLVWEAEDRVAVCLCEDADASREREESQWK